MNQTLSISEGKDLCTLTITAEPGDLTDKALANILIQLAMQLHGVVDEKRDQT